MPEWGTAGLAGLDWFEDALLLAAGDDYFVFDVELAEAHHARGTVEDSGLAFLVAATAPGGTIDRRFASVNGEVAGGAKLW